MNTIYPCGYSVHAGQIVALMEQPRTLLIDLRKTPWSSISAWRRPVLCERYEERYGWFGQTLGNLNYNTGGPIQLANPGPGIARLAALLEEGYDLILLCACRNYEECHRHTVVDLLASRYPPLLIMQPDQIVPTGMCKCLSIRQPWAYLLTHPEILQEVQLPTKTLENRTWSTAFRGQILIHAGSTPDEDLFENTREKRLDHWYWSQQFGQPGERLANLLPQRLTDYPRRALVGRARLVDVITRSTSPWFIGPYAFQLEQLKTITPISYAGQLKLFDVPVSLLAQDH